MLIMTSQILTYVDLTKTQNSRYLEKEIFLLQIKKVINYISKATLWQKILTFNVFINTTIY